MIYNIGDVFYSDEVNARVKCVKDFSSSCEHCVFNECGNSCPNKSYDRHPCYHTDRGDEHDVHFVLADEPLLKVGDKVLWNDPEIRTDSEHRVWEVYEVHSEDMVKICAGEPGMPGYSEAEVPVMEVSLIVDDDEDDDMNEDEGMPEYVLTTEQITQIYPTYAKAEEGYKLHCDYYEREGWELVMKKRAMNSVNINGETVCALRAVYRKGEVRESVELSIRIECD